MQDQPPWSKMGANLMHPETMDTKINLVDVFIQLCKVFKHKLIGKYLQCKCVIIFCYIEPKNFPAFPPNLLNAEEKLRQ